MPMHTITAMFHDKNDAERAASTLRANAGLAVTNVKVLPEEEVAPATSHEQGFMALLRNFFMPEEDRYGFAEGMRRGDYMVAVDADEEHAHHVMDVLEQAGAIDMDAEEDRWRKEGWSGYKSGTGVASTAGAATMVGGTATIPPVPGTTGAAPTGTPMARTTPTEPIADRSSAETMAARDVETTDARVDTASRRDAAVGDAAHAVGTETEERIPLTEERLRVGKRQVMGGRVRIRSYVVETPVTESVHLRQEHVEVERRPVDRPLTGSEADPFREREITATESREEPVVSKETRVREELVLHKSVEEQDETVHDTVRRTEVKEDRGEGAAIDRADTTGNPDVARQR